VLAAAFMLAGPPRFLGPPEKKPADADVPAVGPGAAAPPFSSATANADRSGVRQIDVPALVGAGAKPRTVLLSFFDAACAACKSELAVLDALSARYQAQGLLVISLAADAGALLGARQVSYPVVEDKDSVIARSYLGPKPSFPAAAIVGRDGMIVTVKQGYRDDPAVLLQAQVESALR
jgi:hypothetical protein